VQHLQHHNHTTTSIFCYCQYCLLHSPLYSASFSQIKLACDDGAARKVEFLLPVRKPEYETSELAHRQFVCIAYVRILSAMWLQPCLNVKILTCAIPHPEVIIKSNNDSRLVENEPEAVQRPTGRRMENTERMLYAPRRNILCRTRLNSYPEGRQTAADYDLTHGYPITMCRKSWCNARECIECIVNV
jgi:hypothetical protein